MPSHTGSSKRALGAGATSSVEAAAIPRIDAARKAKKRREAQEQDAQRTGVLRLGRATVKDIVDCYGEAVVARAAGVKVKQLKTWTDGTAIVPAPRRERLHVLRAAQKQLGFRAPQWLTTREHNNPLPIELLADGDINAAWRALRRDSR